MANKRSHTSKTVNWWHEGGDCSSAHYSFSSYTEGQILPPLQLFLLYRMNKLFGWHACAQPLNRACSRQGWISAQVGCCMSPVPLYRPFMCGITYKPVPGHLHSCLPHRPWTHFFYCPECNALCCCLTGENQSVPWNVAFCMRIIELSCFWSSSQVAHLWKKETISVWCGFVPLHRELC